MPSLSCKQFVNTGRNAFSVLAGMGGVWSTHVEINFLSSLAWDGFVRHMFDTLCVLADMGGVWSTHVEIHSVSVLACLGFGQHMLRCVLSPCWHGSGLDKTC